MAEDDWQGEVSILAFDIAGYSKRDNAGQLRAKKLLTDARRGALEECGIAAGETRWQDTGDGGFLMLRGNPHRVLDVLERFVALVEEENAERIADKQVHLRYACHYGKVAERGREAIREYAGDGLNDCARLLDGMKKYSEPVGQVVASGAYRSQVVAFRKASAELFTRLADIEDKHGNAHEVWNLRRLPGYGREAAPRDLHHPQ